MENKENEGTQARRPGGPQEEPHLGAEDFDQEATTSPPPKKGMEERMDEVADKFAKTMAEGVKRMETAFENFKSDAETRSTIKGFFSSSAGGAVLIIIGVLWLFYAIGFFNQWVFPIILIAVGIYLTLRYKSD